MTYHSVLALFPAAIALMSLVGLFGQRGASVDALTSVLSDAGATSLAASVEPTLQTLSRVSGAGLALVLGFLGALWAASGYVDAFGRAMNHRYGIGEGRPVWKRRPLMMLVALVLLVLVAAVLLGLVISGPIADAVGTALGVGSAVVSVWQIAKWPVLLILVVLIVSVLYWATPNVRQPKFRYLSIGALAALIIWIVASVGFGFYVVNFSSYNKTYGALGGVIIFLVWLWITNCALLFGGSLDCEVERVRELQAGIVAEDAVQLPARDMRAVVKEARKRADDVKRGAGLRQQRGKGRQRRSAVDHDG